MSNEPHVGENVRWLRPTGGAYVGVGPEQNFSYIARLRPAIAFIIDIRRENRNLHFLYKALFELSSDRADFVSRLFSRPRPGGLGSTASVDEIFRRFDSVPRSEELHGKNRALVRERLLTTHGLPLSESDLAWIDRAFGAFYADGPQIHFWGSRTVEALRPSYRQLMTTTDVTGQSRSFLASEDDFRFVKDLQSQEHGRSRRRRFWRSLRDPSSGRLRQVASRRRPGLLRLERWRVSEHAADTCLLRQPCGLARGQRGLVHRTRWGPVVRLEAQILRARNQVVRFATNRLTASGAGPQCGRSPFHEVII